MKVIEAKNMKWSIEKKIEEPKNERKIKENEMAKSKAMNNHMKIINTSEIITKAEIE